MKVIKMVWNGLIVPMAHVAFSAALLWIAVKLLISMVLK